MRRNRIVSSGEENAAFSTRTQKDGTCSGAQLLAREMTYVSSPIAGWLLRFECVGESIAIGLDRHLVR